MRGPISTCNSLRWLCLMQRIHISTCLCGTCKELLASLCWNTTSCAFSQKSKTKRSHVSQRTLRWVSSLGRPLCTACTMARIFVMTLLKLRLTGQHSHKRAHSTLNNSLTGNLWTNTLTTWHMCERRRTTALKVLDRALNSHATPLLAWWLGVALRLRSSSTQSSQGSLFSTSSSIMLSSSTTDHALSRALTQSSKYVDLSNHHNLLLTLSY